jgi:hypothetical protein
MFAIGMAPSWTRNRRAIEKISQKLKLNEGKTSLQRTFYELSIGTKIE